MMYRQLSLAALLAATTVISSAYEVTESSDWPDIIESACRAPGDPADDRRFQHKMEAPSGQPPRELTAKERAQLVLLVASADKCVAAGAVGLWYMLRVFSVIKEYPPELVASLKNVLESGSMWPPKSPSYADHRVPFLTNSLRILVTARVPGTTSLLIRVTELESPRVREAIEIAVLGLCAFLPSDAGAEKAIASLLSTRGLGSQVSLKSCPVIPQSFGPGLAGVLESALESGNEPLALQTGAALVRIARAQRGPREEQALERLMERFGEPAQGKAIAKAIQE